MLVACHLGEALSYIFPQMNAERETAVVGK